MTHHRQSGRSCKASPHFFSPQYNFIFLCPSKDRRKVVFHKHMEWTWKWHHLLQDNLKVNAGFLVVYPISVRNNFVTKNVSLHTRHVMLLRQSRSRHPKTHFNFREKNQGHTLKIYSNKEICSVSVMITIFLF